MKKILIVDDSPAIQRSLGRFLHCVPGAQVVGCADDVTGALSLIDAVGPDFVVLDVNLLDGDRGIDVLRYLRRHCPRTEVIALSNTTSTKLREGYLEAGAVAYFDKATEFLKVRDWIAQSLQAAAGQDGQVAHD